MTVRSPRSCRYRWRPPLSFHNRQGRHLYRALGLVALLVAGCSGGDEAEGSTGAGATEDAQAPGSEADPATCGTPTETLSAAADAPAASGIAAATAEELPEPGDRETFPLFDEVAIAVEGPDGEITASCVLLATSPEQRRRGLMEVTDLAGYAGMLFVADDEHTQSFWMRNTPMPLSIAWFDDDGDLVTMLDMEPCDDVPSCEGYGSEGPARFALEVPQGDLPGVGVVEGSILTVGGP